MKATYPQPPLSQHAALLSCLFLLASGANASYSGEPALFFHRGALGCSDQGGGDEDDTTSAPSGNITLTSFPESETILRYARFDFQDDATTYQCSLNGAATTACQGSIFYPDVGSDGDHLFTVSSADNDDDSVSTSYEWTVLPLFDNPTEDLIPATRQPDPAEPNSWRGILRINCDLAQTSYDDPVVFPGIPDATHLHRFYGNTAVDFQTTMESLNMGDGDAVSTCQGNLINLSAYWVPALLADPANSDSWHVVPAVVGGDDVAHEVFYYSAGIDDLEAIQPIPVGLRMVAGDPSATPESPQETSIVRWHCQSWESSDGANPHWSTTVPACVAPDRVRSDIFFPSCWNGVDLDSDDHKSHMAYPVRENGAMVCPASHPVPIVRPSYHFAFGVKPDVYDPVTNSSKGWRLSSDSYVVTDERPGGASLHADWFNGWHPAVMEALLTSCIQAGLDCHDGNLANGYRLSDVREGNDTVPEIFNQGMGYHSSPSS